MAQQNFPACVTTLFLLNILVYSEAKPGPGNYGIVGNDDKLLATKEVTLYEHPNYQGTTFEFLVREDECYNVPAYADDIASSIRTRGNCIRICEHKDCTGRCINMFPETSGHSDFNVIAFHDLLSSMIPC